MRSGSSTASLCGLFVALVACKEPPPRSDSASAPRGSVAETPKAVASAVPSSIGPAFDLRTAVTTYVQEAAAARKAKDAARLAALFTSDGTVAVLRSTGLDEQPAAALESVLKRHFERFPDQQQVTTRVVAMERTAVAEWTFVGTHAEGPEPKKVGYRGASVLTFAEDGRLQHERIYVDTVTMGAQMAKTPRSRVRPVAALPTSPAELAITERPDAAMEAFQRRWLESTKTVDGWYPLASENLVVSSQIAPEDTIGKKAVIAERAASAQLFQDPKVVVKTCLHANRYLVCEYTWTATLTSSTASGLAAPKIGTIHALDVMEVEEGKITRATTYANQAELAAQFGFDEPKETPSETK